MARDCLQMISIIYDMEIAVAVSIYSIFIYALDLDISTYSVYRLLNQISKHACLDIFPLIQLLVI